MKNLELTYCNPTPLPDYPIGRNCYKADNHYKCDYRETADPTVIYEDGKWYLYPSCGMAYVSEDFVTWKHVRIEPYDCGYAPTVVKHKGIFYLLASSSELYSSDNPLGPFKSLGYLRDPDGEKVLVDDPMIFSDDDGRLYLYSGCGGRICGVELDSDNPTQLLSPIKVMFEMDTLNHPWERIGDWNQDDTYSWVEGSWMYKRDGRYYLTYSAPGTEWVTYAMGAYIGDSPLGPWKYMDSSPFLIKRDGIVKGTGHGSIVDGPNNTAWVFYTCCMCYAGEFERRIGYDPIGFLPDGTIMPVKASEIPQFAPGILDTPELFNDAGFVPLTQHSRCAESSASPGRDGLYAIDDSMITWWQPSPDDKEPTLTVKICEDGLPIHSARIIWRDVGLSLEKNVMAGPFRYRVDAQNLDGNWITVLDKSDNGVDMNIDYNILTPMTAKAVRLVILGKPEGIEPGVTNFTVFGSRLPR